MDYLPNIKHPLHNFEVGTRVRTLCVVVVILILNGCLLPKQSLHQPVPLFSITPVVGQDNFEASLLEGLRAWVRQNRDIYKISGTDELYLRNLSSDHTQTFVNNRISIVRFVQSYREIPVYGGSQHVALVVIDSTDVVKISGDFVDEKLTYRGFERRISHNDAEKAMRRHWAEQVSSGEIFIRSLREVAVPESLTIAFVAEVSTPIFSSSRAIQGSIVVDAESGELLGIHNRPAEALVRGFELVDDPFSETLVIHENLPAHQVDNTVHFEPHIVLDCQPLSWVDIRMGDSIRSTVLNLNGSDTSGAQNITVGRCSSGSPEEAFLGGLVLDGVVPTTIYAQDLMVKLQRAFSFIDPLMGDLFTHGSTHPYSWNHHPDVPEIAHRAPVMLAVNSSGGWVNGAPGIYFNIWASQQDTDALDFPVPHPLVFVSAPPEQHFSLIVIRADVPFHTRTLFHEIGHYYDSFNSYGTSSDNEPREILAQLFSLFIHRKVYAELSYTLTEMSNATSGAGATIIGPCSLSALISHSAGQVVHPDCIQNEDQIARSINVTNNGYRIQAFTQAFWSLLFGVSCTGEGSMIDCTVPDDLPTDYEDRWMEALLFTLQLGNEQSFVEVWENMEIFIQANYPSDLELLQSVREFHGLL